MFEVKLKSNEIYSFFTPSAYGVVDLICYYFSGGFSGISDTICVSFHPGFSLQPTNVSPVYKKPFSPLKEGKIHVFELSQTTTLETFENEIKPLFLNDFKAIG